MLEDAELDETETVKEIIDISYRYGNGFRTRKQECLFLTEDGFYEVLIQSHKPIAKFFKQEISRANMYTPNNQITLSHNAYIWSIQDLS